MTHILTLDRRILAATALSTLTAGVCLLLQPGALSKIIAVALVIAVAALLLSITSKAAASAPLGELAKNARRIATGGDETDLGSEDPFEVLSQSLATIDKQHSSLMAFADPTTSEDTNRGATHLLKTSPLAPAIQQISADIAAKEAAQAHATRLFNTTFETTPGAVVVVDAEGTILMANSQAQREIGTQRSLDGVIPNWRSLSGKVTELVRTETDGRKTRLNVLGGSTDADGAGHTVVTWSETPEKPLRTQTTTTGHTDELTGLLNRAGLKASLNPLTDQEVFALHLDLQGLKALNHDHGIDNGNIVLATIAKRLVDESSTAAVIGRTSGDEFTVVSPTRPADADRKVTHLIDVVRRPVELPSGQRISVQVRGGWATGIVDPARKVLDKATTALTEAQGSGAPMLSYNPGMAERVEIRRETENDLRIAVAENQFVLHAQPVVDVFERRVSGLEMLVRWQHPSGEIILPGQFIPVAERIGLIDQIDRFVLESTCAHAKSVGPALNMSLNLSHLFISHPDTTQHVIDTLARYGLAAGRVTIELKEGSSSTAFDAEALRKQAKVLHKAGVHTALDNFGTGYSSIASAMQTPVSTIKIGRALVALVDRPDGRGVISAIVSYAEARKVRVIAEGVETAEQALILHRLGCRYQQGYFHLRPGPVAEVLANLPRAVDAFESHEQQILASQN